MEMSGESQTQLGAGWGDYLDLFYGHPSLHCEL